MLSDEEKKAMGIIQYENSEIKYIRRKIRCKNWN